MNFHGFPVPPGYFQSAPPWPPQDSEPLAGGVVHFPGAQTQLRCGLRFAKETNIFIFFFPKVVVDFFVSLQPVLACRTGFFVFSVSNLLLPPCQLRVKPLQQWLCIMIGYYKYSQETPCPFHGLFSFLPPKDSKQNLFRQNLTPANEKPFKNH